MFSPFSDINPCHSLFLIGIICGPGMLHALQAFTRLCKTLYRRQFRKKSCSKEFVETLFQASSTCSQERRVTDDFELHYGTLQAGNWTKHNEKQANNARRTAGELLGHFPRKIRFVFRSKTFPTKDSLTQKRSNVQDNNDVTKQSLSSIPCIKVRGHFGNVFVKPLAVFVLLTFFTPFHCSERKFGSFDLSLSDSWHPRSAKYTDN